MSKPLKTNILHITSVSFSLHYFIGEQFLYFRQKGYRFFVACSPSEELAPLAEQYQFDYMATPIERKLSPWHDMQSLIAIVRYIRRQQIGIVVGHSPKGALLAMLAARLCRVPKRIYFRHGLVYETAHGLKRAILKAVDRFTSRCATQVVCVSPSLMRKSLEDRLDQPSKQILLGAGTCGGIDTRGKYNPAHIDADKLTAYRKQYGIADTDWIIGYTGRLVRDKGIMDLLEAFDRLPETLHAKLLLVGPFEERDALPQAVQQRILNDPRIVFTGLVHTDMEYFYAMMHVYVLASYREGFPIGALEAQAMQVPVVTTRETGCIDAIIDTQTGVFTTHRPDDIAEAIIQTTRHPDMGAEGRKWVTANFDHSIIWKHIEEIYRI